MATSDEYASWIVANADKKGTPDFDIVAKAYADSKGNQPASVSAGKELNSIPRQLGFILRKPPPPRPNLNTMRQECHE